MSPEHRYVDLNPVAAGIVEDPARYLWSSAAFHLGDEKTDPLVGDRTMLGLVDDWRTLLQDGIDELEAKELEKRLSTGSSTSSSCGSTPSVPDSRSSRGA